jgi:1,4-dihydroxy-2-naphthoyl-CoA hydrolase
VDRSSMTGLADRLEAGETLGAEQLAALVEDSGFVAETLGLVWDEVSAERSRAHLEVGPRHHQPYGIVHGGVWCAVVETLASTAAALRVAASGRLVVGVSNNTDFLRPVREGRVDAVVTPVHVGRSQQLWSVSLSRAADGKAVARGQVRLQNVDPAQVGGT